MTYMAACEGTTCDKYNSTDAGWFKIDQAGQNPNGTGWVQQEISTSPSSHGCTCGSMSVIAVDGEAYTLNLPNNIVPGDYLIRHEVRESKSYFQSSAHLEYRHRSSSGCRSRSPLAARSSTLPARRYALAATATVHPTRP